MIQINGNADFSYRIVAVRRGYEGVRMAPAPWTDNDPHLFPERNTVSQDAQGGMDN